MLRETQDRFAAALLSATPPDVAALSDIAANHVTATDRFSVYRDNVRAGLTAALCAAYPAVRLIVGAPFMDMMAARYIDTHAPQCADINMYGATFPAFIRDFPPAADLPYLPDTAQFEWLLHRAAFAADTDALDPQSLVALPPARQDTVCLRLRPGIFPAQSPWPVATIHAFALAQHEDKTLDVDGGGGCWLIARPALDVVIDAIPPSHAAFYSLCDGTMSLAAITADITARYPDFDLAALLAHAFRYAVFTALPADP